MFIFTYLLCIDNYISIMNEHILSASCIYRDSTRRLLQLFHSDNEPTNEVIPKLMSE